MRLVDIESVEPGQVLGKSIYSSNGTIMLAQGVQLTVFMISQLKRLGVTMLYIKDPDFADVVVEDPISEETKQMVIRQLSETFDSIRSGKQFSTKAISNAADQLLQDIMENQDVLLHLSDIRTHDNAAYLHAINVCAASVMIGLNLGYNMQQLKELAIGALLHDIGKIDAPDNEEGRNHHAWRGFETLKNQREFSLLVAHVALQHHEHIDGTGQPRGLTSDQIHPYAKITAVANTYDNLLHPTDGGRVLPHEAAETLNALSGTKLDHEMLVLFNRFVSIYPNGISVRLSNRQTGVVVGQHRGLPGRPIVRVLARDRDDVRAEEIDLARHPTLFIEAVLS